MILFVRSYKANAFYFISDVESGVKEADLGFGKTKYDVLLKSWERHLYIGNETHVGNFTMEVALEDGVLAWAKVRGINGGLKITFLYVEQMFFLS